MNAKQAKEVAEKESYMKTNKRYSEVKSFTGLQIINTYVLIPR